MEAPIIAEGAASLYDSFSNLAAPYARQKIKMVWTNRGMAMTLLSSGGGLRSQYIYGSITTKLKFATRVTYGEKIPRKLKI